MLCALLIARQLGIACDGRGARPKLYFLLNALLREWVTFLFIWKRAYLRVLAVSALMVFVSNIISLIVAP